MIAELLERLLAPPVLGPATVRALFATLTDPAVGDAEKAALLVAGASRPDRPAELVLAAREMRRRAIPFPLPSGDRPIDLCGSGGAPRPSFNVSTVSAFVVAAAGVPVVKHGNRSFRGACGSSDLLEALGIPVTGPREFAERTYAAEKIAFLHAPTYHPAMASIREVRRRIGIPTLFNRLGPLSNPAAVPYQVVGARDGALARTFASVLPALGVRRGAALSSPEGCDEFSPRRPTTAFVWSARSRARRTVRPARLLRPAERAGAWGALPPAEAAEETRRILAGGRGARLGSVLLTSGQALWVARAVPSLAAGVQRARETVETGAALGLLDRLVELGGTAGGHER